MKILHPQPLFDEVIKDYKLKNDAALCKMLQLQPSLVSRMRTGALPVSDTVRVVIMRKCRWPLKRLDQLAPPYDSTSYIATSTDE